MIMTFRCVLSLNSFSSYCPPLISWIFHSWNISFIPQYVEMYSPVTFFAGKEKHTRSIIPVSEHLTMSLSYLPMQKTSCWDTEFGGNFSFKALTPTCCFILSSLLWGNLPSSQPAFPLWLLFKMFAFKHTCRIAYLWNVNFSPAMTRAELTFIYMDRPLIGGFQTVLAKLL